MPTRSRVKLFSLYENGSPHFCFFRTNAPCSFVTVILFHSKIDNKTLLFYPSLNVHQAAVCSQCCHVSHAVSSPQTETTPQHELPTWPPPAPRVLGTLFHFLSVAKLNIIFPKSTQVVTVTVPFLFMAEYDSYSRSFQWP